MKYYFRSVLCSSYYTISVNSELASLCKLEIFYSRLTWTSVLYFRNFSVSPPSDFPRLTYKGIQCLTLASINFISVNALHSLAIRN